MNILHTNICLKESSVRKGDVMRKCGNGFTLIEVIIILALLATGLAVAAPNFLAVRESGEKLACQDQMDLVLKGFQDQQMNADDPYAYVELAGDGEVKLQAYIDFAISHQFADVDFEEQVVCPSGNTQYQPRIKDGRLFIYCPVHRTYSHASLTARPLRSKVDTYTKNTLTGNDSNWIIGDHESLTTMPLPSEYYHMEIQIRLFLYDDGAEGRSHTHEYDYSLPEWFWPINETFYTNVGGSDYDESVEPRRPHYYDLDQYNSTNDDLFLGLVIDYQENEGLTNFTANALEIKNVNSNAGLDMELDLVERDKFNSQKSDHATHQRDLMDEIADWIILDVMESDTPGMKRMVIHMQTDPKKENDSNFKKIFDDLVPVANPDEPIKFAFFVGNRDVDTSSKVGQYYYNSFPTPVQADIQRWHRNYEPDTVIDGRTYEQWISHEYKGYDGADGSPISAIPFD